MEDTPNPPRRRRFRGVTRSRAVRDLLPVLTEEILKNAGFKVTHEVHDPDHPYTVTAEGVVKGQGKQCAIEYMDLSSGEELSFLIWLANFDELPPIEPETWVISNEVSRKARQSAERNGRIRVFTPEGLKQFVSSESSPTRERARAKTSIGTAVKANRDEIVLASVALETLIEERIASLRSARPNSKEAKAVRDDSIAQYESLRRHLNDLRENVITFSEGRSMEATVVTSSSRFSECVGRWWAKKHQDICSKGYEIGLFAAAVAICSLAGSGGQLAVLVSAALVGGKPVVSALRGASKKMFS